MSNGGDKDKLSGARAPGAAPGSASRNVTIIDDHVNSQALLGNARHITIDHGAEAYILRLTAQNKLILTK